MAVTEIKRDGQLSEIGLGNLGAQVNLRGYDGAKKDPVLNTVLSTGNYGLIEQTTHGKHVAVPLALTAVTAAPTPANSVLLVDDGGLSVGAGTYVRLYDGAGIDYVQISSDIDGGLVLAGSGANAGQLSFTTLVASGNLLWKSGTAFTMTFDHAITANRTVLFQDLAGTVALLGAQNAGNLLFADNTYDIGASGATRPRDLFLSRNGVIGGALSITTGGITIVAGGMTAAGQITSTVATGLAPFVIASTTNVPNLNATYLNDKLDTAFAQLGAASNFTVAPTISGSAIARIGNAASFTTLTATSTATLQGNLAHTGLNLGVYNVPPVARQTVTGSRGGNAALLDVITKLENIGLFINGTTP